MFHCVFVIFFFLISLLSVIFSIKSLDPVFHTFLQCLNFPYSKHFEFNAGHLSLSWNSFQWKKLTLDANLYLLFLPFVQLFAVFATTWISCCTFPAAWLKNAFYWPCNSACLVATTASAKFKLGWRYNCSLVWKSAILATNRSICLKIQCFFFAQNNYQTLLNCLKTFLVSSAITYNIMFSFSILQ